MLDAPFHQELIERLGRRAHAGVALPEGNNGKAHALQVLRHLGRAPAVECDLQDVVFLTRVVDELFDEAIVDDVALSRQKVALLTPDILTSIALPIDGI